MELNEYGRLAEFKDIDGLFLLLFACLSIYFSCIFFSFLSLLLSIPFHFISFLVRQTPGLCDDEQNLDLCGTHFSGASMYDIYNFSRLLGPTSLKLCVCVCVRK